MSHRLLELRWDSEHVGVEGDALAEQVPKVNVEERAALVDEYVVRVAVAYAEDVARDVGAGGTRDEALQLLGVVLQSGYSTHCKHRLGDRSQLTSFKKMEISPFAVFKKIYI